LLRSRAIRALLDRGAAAPYTRPGQCPQRIAAMDDTSPKPRRTLSDTEITTRRSLLRPSPLAAPLVGGAAKPGAGAAQAEAHNDHDA